MKGDGSMLGKGGKKRWKGGREKGEEGEGRVDIKGRTDQHEEGDGGMLQRVKEKVKKSMKKKGGGRHERGGEKGREKGDKLVKGRKGM